VAGGVIGLVFLSAAPDHAGPGAGEHANGVGVAHAAGAGLDVGNPGLLWRESSAKSVSARQSLLSTL
jgi:hypothetical protein